MFCKNCGSEIDDKAVVCPKCGVAVNNSGKQVAPDDAKSAGFAVLAFFFPLIGLILYLVWHETSPLKASSCGKGALIGVCVNIFVAIISVVIYSCAIATIIGTTVSAL